MLLFSILLFFCFISTSSSICPNGSIKYFSDETHCIYFKSNKTYFLNAEEICMNLGGHLASVHSMFDNMFLSQQALNNFTDSTDTDFWFGANDLANSGIWAWMDGTSFDFTDWDKGQPQNMSGSDCGAVVMAHGKWIADDCFKQKPFVCEVTASTEAASTPVITFPTTRMITTAATTTLIPKPKTCPEGWTYYSTTGYCYVVLKNNTWLNAETHCKIDGGHLASIHSLNEDLFIAHLVQPSFAWLGFYTEDNNAHYKWTDGTPIDYTSWRSGEPNNPGVESCALIYSEGGWNNGVCSNSYSFVCKSLPS